MADVKLLQYDGSEKQYLGVEKVMLATTDGGTALFSEGEAVEGVQILPDFSAGDMTVDAPAGTLVKSAVVLQPETLVPENIRRGVTVAGIEGDLIGDTEERTVDLDMSAGDQIVLPTQEGKVISKVTVTKPETLVPENIAKDVTIGGVTGTLEPPEAVPVEVTLDFTDGPMEITPEEGKVISSVTIPVPETLVPENIAEGVNIAGIIGSLTGGNENFLAKIIDADASNTSGYCVLFTKEELDEIGFSSASKRGAMVIALDAIPSGATSAVRWAYSANYVVEQNGSSNFYARTFYASRTSSSGNAYANNNNLTTNIMKGSSYTNGYIAYMVSLTFRHAGTSNTQVHLVGRYLAVAICE